MGTWKNLQKGFTANECLSGTVADDCVRLTSRNHSQRQKEVIKKPPCVRSCLRSLLTSKQDPYKGHSNHDFTGI